VEVDANNADAMAMMFVSKRIYWRISTTGWQLKWRWLRRNWRNEMTQNHQG